MKPDFNILYNIKKILKIGNPTKSELARRKLSIQWDIDSSCPHSYYMCGNCGEGLSVYPDGKIMSDVTDAQSRKYTEEEKQNTTCSENCD